MNFASIYCAFVLITVTVETQSKSISEFDSIVAKRRENLSESFTVEWHVYADNPKIEFRVTAKTTGYIGFGISPNGTMEGADFIIGGVVTAGVPYFKDYHMDETNSRVPAVDKDQNWYLLDAKEEAGFTTLRFERSIVTCDNNEDLIISGDTTRFIWSVGSTDTIEQHTAANRGSLLVNILDPPTAEQDMSQFRSTDILQRIYLSSEETTVYQNMIFRHSSLSKSHIVAFKPKLETPDALKHTHHFNVYKCEAPYGEDLVDYFEQYTGGPLSEYSPATGYCSTDLYAWSLGGRILKFPDNVGFPWGLEADEYYLFSVHIDNSEGLDNVSFETGFTVYDTEVLRKHEASIWTLGYGNQGYIVVPPNTRDWEIQAHCSSKCTEEYLYGTTGMNLINVNLHAHKSGQKIKIRQFRNNSELPWIAYDGNYDVHYQENRPLPEGIKILPGDHVTLECTYDSNWANGTTVFNGASTSDEMCMAFVYYYPKSRLISCGSSYSSAHIESILNVSSLYFDPESVIWTDQRKTELENGYLQGEQATDCYSDSEDPFLDNLYYDPYSSSDEAKTTKYPSIDVEYEPQISRCYEDSKKNILWFKNQEESLNNRLLGVLAVFAGVFFFGILVCLCLANNGNCNYKITDDDAAKIQQLLSEDDDEEDCKI